MSLPIKRALVIGASGFIGLNLVDALQEKGIVVRATKRKKSITVHLRKRKPEWAIAELEDVAALEQAMVDCDVVFFAAGYYPRFSTNMDDALRIATTQAANVLAAFAKSNARKLIYTSSIGLLEKRADGAAMSEADVPATLPEDSVYRAVKVAMEKQMSDARAEGMNVTTLLPSGCIGPWDVRLGTGSLLVGILAGALPWWVDGTINLVDVRDVALAHIRAAERKSDSGRYVLNGHSMRLGEFFRSMVERYGGEMPAEELCLEDAKKRADAEELAAEKTQGRVPVPREFVDILENSAAVDCRGARADLGFAPRDLWISVEDACNWFKKYRYIKTFERRQREPGSKYV